MIQTEMADFHLPKAIRGRKPSEALYQDKASICMKHQLLFARESIDALSAKPAERLDLLIQTYTMLYEHFSQQASQVELE